MVEIDQKYISKNKLLAGMSQRDAPKQTVIAAVPRYMLQIQTTAGML